MYGFDIETADNNKTFICATLYTDGYVKTLYTKDDVIKELKKDRYRGSIISATNLGFDFFGVFFDNKEMENFNILLRGSDLLYARTYIVNGQFVLKSKYSNNRLMFYDTFNFVRMSVEKMGKIIDIPKLSKPAALGRHPGNKKEWDDLVTYNIRDAEVSYRFMLFLIKSFEDLGATFKMTIASTSMSLFKNKYLDNEYYRHPVDVINEQFKAYYGGRTEVFKRGLIKDANYYDLNSLYPSVMHDNVYPDPNTLMITRKNTTEFIEKYEGISNVDVYCPDMNIPLLPYRYDNKLLFPKGEFSGWYSHVELRKAVELGYTIKRVKKTYYYTKTCTPFKSYVRDLYRLRLKHKKEGNPMQIADKLLLNSLYGKFGQKFKDVDDWRHINNLTLKQAQEGHTEIVGAYVRSTKDVAPSSFCVPVWAVYTTAYARLKLYEYLQKYDPIYCDTDSVITTHDIPTSDKLGDMKLEMFINKGWIVKPKMYAVENDTGEQFIKVKGLGKRLDMPGFIELMTDRKSTVLKFAKFKESLRRGLIPNETFVVTKNFSLDDNKRVWDGLTFNPDILQRSQPITMIKGMSEHDYNVHTTVLRDDIMAEHTKELVNSDLFDSASVGKDIEYDEFIENEQFWETL